MSIHLLILYTLIITVIVYCPGPMTMFAMGISMKVGLKDTLFALLGGSSAYICELIIVSFGLSLISKHAEIIFHIIKWVGVIYLIYIGIQQWRSTGLPHKVKIEQPSYRLKHNLFFRGFFVGATNPKAMIIFTALFPQFINIHASHTKQFLILSGIFLILQFSSAFSYAAFGSKVFKWLHKNNKEKLQYRITGSILIMAGILLSIIKI